MSFDELLFHWIEAETTGLSGEVPFVAVAGSILHGLGRVK
jgi:hypothetical protein